MLRKSAQIQPNYRIGRVLWRATLVLLAMLIVLPSRAVNYALLVGVSEYPALDEDHQLRGPKNDVVLMKEVLTRRGLDPSNVKILADGVAGAELPTRSAILGALQRVQERFGQGDRLYLHLSGHATQQPNGPQDNDHEPDGFDEVFLPRDAATWSPTRGTIENGILDDEIGELIGRMVAKGAFVWLVADTCNAGTIVRGAFPRQIRYRGIRPGSLNVPNPTTALVSRTKAWGTASFHVEVPVSAGSTRAVAGVDPSIDPESNPSGTYVAFYAAREGEPEPEMKLPEGAVDARWHGLLTRRLAESLSATHQLGRTTTYRRLGERIRQRYAGRLSPTPEFEGPGLDEILLGADASSPADFALQWRIFKRTYPAGVYIPVGRLAQIGEGSRFALLARPDDDTTSALGLAEVSHAKELSAELKPIAADGNPALGWGAIPADGYARLIRRAIDFTVRVSQPELLDNASAAERAAADLIGQLARQKTSAGIRFTWVGPDETADLRLGFTPRDSAQCRTAADQTALLWIAEGDGGIRCNGPRQNISIKVARPEAEVRTLLLDTLERMATVLNLNRIAERLSAAPTGAMVKVDLRILAVGDGKHGNHAPIRLTPEVIANPKGGDRISLDLKNTGDTPLDVNIFFVDGRYGIRRIYPKNHSQPITLEPNQAIKTIQGKITIGTQGQEQIIVIAVEHNRQRSPLDLGFLAQSTMELQRGARGEIQQTGDDIMALFQSAGIGVGGTRRALDPFHRRASVTVYRWRLDTRASAE